MLIGLKLQEIGNPFYEHEGQKSWTHIQGDQYVATGIDRNGKRFRRVSSNWMYISGINTWKGSKWLVRGGKRFLIQRIEN
jgi:hypothetical protein